MRHARPARLIQRVVVEVGVGVKVIDKGVTIDSRYVR
jgi:hypothetical protein